MNEQQSFLWLSGWSISADIWQPFWKEWPDATHHALSFHRCKQVNDIIDQAVAAFQQIDARRVIVIGWSLGAMVALQLALHFPKRISHLFLVAGLAQFTKRKPTDIGWDERVLRRMKKQLQVSPAEVIHFFDQKMFSSTEQDEGQLEHWRKQWRKEIPPLPALQAGLDFLEQYALTDLSKLMRLPVFLLSGAEDPICSAAGARALAHQLPRSVCTIWPGRGHACFWTQQERFQQWIRGGLHHGDQ